MTTTVSVEQAPTTIVPSEAKSFFADVDDAVVEWRSHFDRKRREFASNEVVAAEVTVQLGEAGQPYLLAANASCSADSFWPSDLDEAAKAALESLAGSTVAVLMTIGDRTGRQFCHGNKYTIDSHIRVAQLPVNPTINEILMLPIGSSVIIEGRVTRFDSRDEQEYWSSGRPRSDLKRRGRIFINTPNGEIMVERNNEKFQYEKGVLENLRGKPIMVGEKVRITAVISDSLILKCGYEQPFLLGPHLQRQAEYDALREDIARWIAAFTYGIETGEYKAARVAFATIRQLELTHDERELLATIARSMPLDEQPVFNGQRFAMVDDLLTAYGVDVETLNAEEFVAFAREILSGERVNSPRGDGRTDQSYVYRFFDDDSRLDNDLLTQLIIETIQVRMPLLEQATDDMDSHWDHSYLIEASVAWLIYTKTREAYLELLRFVEYCLEKGYYRREREEGVEQCPRRLDSLLTKAFSSLLELFRENNDYGFEAQSKVREWVNRLEQDATVDSYTLSEARRLLPWRS